MTVENQTGKGSIYSTHMVAFQEHSQLSVVTIQKIKLEGTRRRSLEHPEAETITISVDPTKEPSLLLDSMPSEGSYLDPFPVETEYLAWAIFRIFRKINAPDQVFPPYSAWKIQVRTSCSEEPVERTFVTYLLPIPAKVTDFSTVNQYLLYMQKLAEEVDMLHVNVTLDVRAAVNAYKLCWNYPERLKNVLIHRGDFIFLKENFNVIGKIVEGSGFNDTACQVGVCFSGS